MLQEGFAYGEAFLFFCPAAFTMCPQANGAESVSTRSGG